MISIGADCDVINDGFKAWAGMALGREGAVLSGGSGGYGGN